MPNPIYQQYGQQQQGSNQISDMISQFQQFKKQFTGDPKQVVQNLLNSGKMSQQQFEQLRGMATQFQRLING